jgi:ribosomal peptide maturation radical SAM protein 1
MMANSASSYCPEATPSAREDADVVLLYMPWATTTRPSLALGILSRLCNEKAISSATLYPNLDMTSLVGFECAGRFANERSLYGLSEHLFACDIFGAGDLNSDEYIDALTELELPEPFKDPQFIRNLRDVLVPEFLTNVCTRVLSYRPRVVGFSSTFNQVMASLAAANRLKAQADVTTIFGGACFDGEMGEEYHRSMPQIIDHVFLGEAENSFRDFLYRIKYNHPTCGIPGVTYFENGRLSISKGEPLINMNESPAPDYDSFFIERERVRARTGHVFNIEYLPFEGSRGCWWGQKNHCLFCGINSELMSFREKDIDRVIHEMVSLSARYQVTHLTASDWIISRKSRTDFFRQLKELDLDIECFYETRADLSKDEVKLMHESGVVKIQPGIESFSTELLKLMRKGTTRIRHVQFLRWCKEYDIHLSYNLLAGFPGEKVEWYHEMAEFLPRIYHIQPPLHNLHFVEMHRFSPLFSKREEYGVDQYQLREDYGFNFPEGLVDTKKVGYFFSFKSKDLVAREAYTERVRSVVGSWIEKHESKYPPIYEYKIGPGFTKITDTRVGEGRYLTLADLHQDVFLLCDEIQSVRKLKQLLGQIYPDAIANGGVERAVNDLLDDDVLMKEGQSLLALPIGCKPRLTSDLIRYVLNEATVEEEPQLISASMD